MNGEPVNNYNDAFRPCNGFVLSYTGSLVEAIEIDGIVPDGMLQKDMDAACTSVTLRLETTQFVYED